MTMPNEVVKRLKAAGLPAGGISSSGMVAWAKTPTQEEETLAAKIVAESMPIENPHPLVMAKKAREGKIDKAEA